MALKRQQAAEDAIALHLASAESGTNYEYLPPGRIYGMQVTSPCPIPPEQPDTPSNTESCASEEMKEKIATIDTIPDPKSNVSNKPKPDNLVVSPASIEMLSKLFPNKKRAVLELVLKRCNHDLLKAIEHFNSKSTTRPILDVTITESSHNSAFKPVANKSLKLLPPPAHPASATIPILAAGSKVFMHNFYPFLPLFNPQPVLQNPAVYVPGLCECEQCKHGLYSRLDQRP